MLNLVSLLISIYLIYVKTALLTWNYLVYSKPTGMFNEHLLNSCYNYRPN